MASLDLMTSYWLQGFLYGLLKRNWATGFAQLTIMDLNGDDAAAEIVLETMTGRRLLISISELISAEERDR